MFIYTYILLELCVILVSLTQYELDHLGVGAGIFFVVERLVFTEVKRFFNEFVRLSDLLGHPIN